MQYVALVCFSITLFTLACALSLDLAPTPRIQGADWTLAWTLSGNDPHEFTLTLDSLQLLSKTISSQDKSPWNFPGDSTKLITLGNHRLVAKDQQGHILSTLDFQVVAPTQGALGPPPPTSHSPNGQNQPTSTPGSNVTPAVPSTSPPGDQTGSTGTASSNVTNVNTPVNDPNNTNNGDDNPSTSSFDSGVHAPNNSNNGSAFITGMPPTSPVTVLTSSPSDGALSTSATPPVPTTNEQLSATKKSNTSVIIGAVLGSIVFLLALIGGVFVWRRSRNRTRPFSFNRDMMVRHHSRPMSADVTSVASTNMGMASEAGLMNSYGTEKAPMLNEKAYGYGSH